MTRLYVITIATRMLELGIFEAAKLIARPDLQVEMHN